MAVHLPAENTKTFPGTPKDLKKAKNVKIFQPFRQKSVTFHNRIGVPPMCMYSVVDGAVNDFHLMHYGSLVIKGPGLKIIEASAVVYEGCITPGDLGFWSDEHIEPLNRLVKAIKSQEFLCNSAFVQHAAQDLEINARWPKQYTWAVNKARRHDKEKIKSE